MATIAEALAAALRQHQAGQLAEAEALYRQILAVDPRHADALHLLGVIAHQVAKHELAVELIGQALALNGTAAQYHNHLGDALRALKRLPAAVESYRRALDLDPTLAAAHLSLGAIAYGAADFAAAAASYRSAAAFAPGNAEAHANLANALFQQGLSAEAVEPYRRALALRPEDASTHANFGLALSDLGHLDQAIEHCRRAIAINPEFSSAHNNLGLALLLKGDFAGGLPHHEWRWKVEGLRMGGRRFDRPPWRGEALQGARILLHAEQGVGDTLQFLRYAPLVARAGGTVLLEVHRELKRLAASVVGASEVVAQGETLPQFEQHCPLLSLMLAFGTDLGSIPAEVPYLSAPKPLVQQWRERLGRGRGKRVGLVWAGRPEHRRDRDRSLSIGALAPLAAIHGVNFFSLQKGPRAAEAKNLSDGVAIEDIAPMLGDFAETAAAMAALDLIITVDTSVAHLAGATGRPVWVLLPRIPDWRWLLDREDSPWYPTVRLFRQAKAGDWASVIDRVAAELRRWVANGGGAGST
jgi:tetratricopeptide (TPR) repeat protein